MIDMNHNWFLMEIRKNRHTEMSSFGIIVFLEEISNTLISIPSSFKFLIYF